MKSIIKKSFIDTIPVLTGYIVLGIGFGIVLGTKGYDVKWSFLMSTFIYAGSMQFVAIDFLGTGASLITVALTTLMVNCRHLFYGISMVDKYKDAGAEKPYLIFALTDETYSLVCNENDDIDPARKRTYRFLVSLFDQCYWITGSVLGSLLGMIIPFDVTGIDFALTALFLTVLVEQWLSFKDHIYAIVGVLSSVACLLLFGSDNFLIPSMIVITIVLAILKHFRGDASQQCISSENEKKEVAE